jgi:hypothetical protein
MAKNISKSNSSFANFSKHKDIFNHFSRDIELYESFYENFLGHKNLVIRADKPNFNTDSLPQWFREAQTDQGVLTIIEGKYMFGEGVKKANEAFSNGIFNPQTSWFQTGYPVAFWLDGVWEGDLFCGNIWENGTWAKGVFYNSSWEAGDWLSGAFVFSTWHNGYWHAGEFVCGIWHRGIWISGTYEGTDCLGFGSDKSPIFIEANKETE